MGLFTVDGTQVLHVIPHNAIEKHPPRISEGSCYLVNEPSFIGVTSTPNPFSEFLHLAVLLNVSNRSARAIVAPFFRGAQIRASFSLRTGTEL